MIIKILKINLQPNSMLFNSNIIQNGVEKVGPIN